MKACAEANSYLEAGVPVGQHLADQLIIPLALAEGGSILTATPSLHTRTNIDVVAQLLGRRLKVAEERPGVVRIG